MSKASGGFVSRGALISQIQEMKGYDSQGRDTGQWEKTGRNIWGLPVYQCSNCRTAEIFIPKNGESFENGASLPFICKFDYCPCCGAKMKTR